MAVKDDTWKMVRTVNRVLGDSLTEEKLDTLFERMWPELQKNLGEIPDVAGAAVPVRSEKEMMAEVLELVRAAAGSNTNVLEALGLLAARMREVLDQVKPRVPLSALATGLPTWWEANALATRRVARLSDLAGTAAAASSSAGGVGEPNMSAPGSPAVGGQIAVPQPAPAASLMREGGEKREQKPERSHRPLISRKGAKEKRKEGQSSDWPRNLGRVSPVMQQHGLVCGKVMDGFRSASHPQVYPSHRNSFRTQAGINVTVGVQ